MTNANEFLNQDTPTQKEEILNWLKSGKGITQLDAINKLKNTCTRLGARIWELEKEGHQITTEMVELINKNTGKKKRFARYWLKKSPELFDK